MKFLYVLTVMMILCNALQAQKNNYQAIINNRAGNNAEKVIAWRHDFHLHPEFGNREERTSAIIAKHLQSLGLEVRTSIAVTGVVGILMGDKPGPVVALRADMDALPVTEKTDVPFASKAQTTYNGHNSDVQPGI
jgi:amidohydrolase